MISFIYYLVLLFILFIIINILFNNRRKSPKKIKIFIRCVVLTFLLRYLSLITMCLLDNPQYIYLFKEIIYLNYLGIPLIVIALFYINLRFEKLKFNFVYYIGAIVILLYFVSMFFLDSKISLDERFGYIINLKYGDIISVISIFVLGILLIIGIIFSNKPNINKTSIYALIVILIIMILENILIACNISPFPYSIISELLLLIMVNTTISNFNKRI